MYFCSRINVHKSERNPGWVSGGPWMETALFSSQACVPGRWQCREAWWGVEGRKPGPGELPQKASGSQEPPQAGRSALTGHSGEQKREDSRVHSPSRRLLPKAFRVGSGDSQSCRSLSYPTPAPRGLLDLPLDSICPAVSSQSLTAPGELTPSPHAPETGVWSPDNELRRELRQAPWTLGLTRMSGETVLPVEH